MMFHWAAHDTSRATVSKDVVLKSTLKRSPFRAGTQGRSVVEFAWEWLSARPATSIKKTMVVVRSMYPIKVRGSLSATLVASVT
jgi:hypothetical protein